MISNVALGLRANISRRKIANIASARLLHCKLVAQKTKEKLLLPWLNLESRQNFWAEVEIQGTVYVAHIESFCIVSSEGSRIYFGRRRVWGHIATIRQTTKRTHEPNTVKRKESDSNPSRSFVLFYSQNLPIHLHTWKDKPHLCSGAIKLTQTPQSTNFGIIIRIQNKHVPAMFWNESTVYIIHGSAPQTELSIFADRERWEFLSLKQMWHTCNSNVIFMVLGQFCTVLQCVFVHTKHFIKKQIHFLTECMLLCWSCLKYITNIPGTFLMRFALRMRYPLKLT